MVKNQRVHKHITFMPWIQAMRLHRATGNVLLFLPCLWSSLIAHNGIWDWADLSILGVGAIWAHSLGCLHNDVVDYALDARVERTKNRPIAAGDIARKDALWGMCVLCALGSLFLMVLPLSSLIWGFLGMALAVLYPFCKRFTHLPQVVLAIAYNMGVFIAPTMAGVPLRPAFFFLYLAGCIWTLEYDLIYAYQDYRDDRREGIGSLAVLCGAQGHVVLYVFLAVRLALLGAVGLYEGISLLGMLLPLGGMTAFLYYRLDIENTEQCGRLFRLMGWLGLWIAVTLTSLG